MEAVRKAWTDERLDDRNHRVDEGFKEMRVEFRAVRFEISSQFAAQQRMMIQLFGGMIATMAIGFAGIVATVIAQT
jgi:hypothetical protein